MTDRDELLRLATLLDEFVSSAETVNGDDEVTHGVNVHITKSQWNRLCHYRAVLRDLLQAAPPVSSAIVTCPSCQQYVEFKFSTPIGPQPVHSETLSKAEGNTRGSDLLADALKPSAEAMDPEISEIIDQLDFVVGCNGELTLGPNACATLLRKLRQRTEVDVVMAVLQNLVDEYDAWPHPKPQFESYSICHARALIAAFPQMGGKP